MFAHVSCDNMLTCKYISCMIALPNTPGPRTCRAVAARDAVSESFVALAVAVRDAVSALQPKQLSWPIRHRLTGSCRLRQLLQSAEAPLPSLRVPPARAESADGVR